MASINGVMQKLGNVTTNPEEVNPLVNLEKNTIRGA